MADQQIIDKTELAEAADSADVVFIRDTDDLTDTPTGTDKYQTVNNFRTLKEAQAISYNTKATTYVNIGSTAIRLDFLTAGGQYEIRDNTQSNLLTINEAAGTVTIGKGGLTITNGNVVITAGDFSMLAGNVLITGNVNINSGDFSVNNGFVQGQRILTTDSGATNTIEGDISMVTGGITTREIDTTDAAATNTIAGDLMVDDLLIDVSANRIDKPTALTIAAEGNFTFEEVNSGSQIVLNAANNNIQFFPVGIVDVNGQITADQFNQSANSTPPANASDTGTTGEIRIDGNYIYYCSAVNTWVRVALATW